MDKYIIGENAGKVWRLLNSDHLRKWEFSEIKKITGMDDAELGSAIYNPQIQKSGETKTKGSKSGKNPEKSQFQAVIEI